MRPASWLERGSRDFPAARASLSVSTWQPDREPAAIARASGPDDVVAAVLAAAERGLRVAVRSGGHSLSATHLASGAVTLDLRDLDQIEVDTDDATAWVEPGATVARTAAALHAAGMSFPVGHAPTVGLGGFLLAGGNGWNTPTWGHGCERILAAEVVLPDGERRLVDRDHDTDLWRAARGAGPFFPGVVVRFLLQLERGAAWVRRGFANTAASDPASLGSRIDDLLATVPASVETTVFWHPAHGAHDEPYAMIALTAFDVADPAADPVTALRRQGFDAVGTGAVPLAEVVRRLPRHDGDALASDHVWTDSAFAHVLPRLPQDGETLTDCSCVLLTTGSRRADGASPADALYRPAGSMSVSAYAHWDPATQPREPQVAWTREVTAALAELATGRYVGEADLDNGPRAVEHCFPTAARVELAATLARHDPTARMAASPRGHEARR
ncbi:FAD-binding protein [Pseudactinotalea suaedae]|uniref:FAD-binding protein n=1 Tax=Pseudactinotalea suaedae TaxID=1524924 RepID=UPI0012E112A9|nr:FAD-binding protein [Pseudactinotalea suaedae]